LAIKAALGEMGETLLFDSDRVVSDRVRDDGYRFRHTDLGDALRDILGR
jgi:NAD dependent epimerase/dehydratase family enzyme